MSREKATLAATIIAILAYSSGIAEENKENRSKVKKVTDEYCSKYNKEDIMLEDFDTEEFELLMRTHEVKFSDLLNDYTTFAIIEFSKHLVSEMRSLLEEDSGEEESNG